MVSTRDKPAVRDYGLTGQETAAAIARGLAEASWYCPQISKDEMRVLLQRRDWPALRDTLLWFSLIIGCGWLGYRLWSAGSHWAVVPFLIYGVLNASSSDSRWHETSHGTAFKTDWLNDALYEIASFMLMREATVWRWSHTRHHSDTNIVGRDPEIAVPRPPDFPGLLLNELFGVKTIPKYFSNLVLHCCGRLTAEQKTFIPESDYQQVFIRAPIYLSIYAGVVGLAIYHHSILPLLFVGLPTLYGSWLLPVYATTQHAGLAEDVLDHRLNSRTIYMNRVNRYLYWNMNYHLEHHLFPLVPYHQLARLHEIVKPELPPPYRSLWNAWTEVIPALFRQAKDPGYCVKRTLPQPPRANPDLHAAPQIFTAKGQAVNGWAEVCVSAILKSEDVIRFDHRQRTYAIYRAADAALFASDGICTHGNTHLADGLVKGRLIECPKHNGRFDITDGSAQRLPACVALRTYPVREHDGKIFIDVESRGDSGSAQPTYKLRVISNEYVATFIKELVLEGEGAPLPAYQPGDFLQFNIPAFEDIFFRELDVKPPFNDDWHAQGLFDLRSENLLPMRRNYSLATNPAADHHLRFNIRIATPPYGLKCAAGAGSAYVHRLKPGDTITAIGPFGSFHIRPGESEMVYVGGGAGMAPLRSHLSHLFETLKTGRRVSFWYGARSRREIFYRDYFDALAHRCPNFSFHVALSEPRPEDEWCGDVGLIHEVLRDRYLANHADRTALEYYLCGPPPMIKAATQMLRSIGVDPSRISFDEF